MIEREMEAGQSSRTLVGDLVAALYECAGAVRQQGEYVAGTAGQTVARWEVLYVIGEAPRTAPQIGRRLGRTRQGVQRVLDMLAAEGLVTSQPNVHNRRSPVFSLTPAGHASVVAMNTLASEWHEAVIEEFGRDGVHDLTDWLRRLTKLARDATPQ